MIPMVAGHSCCRTNIPWQDRSAPVEEDEYDGHSADSSRCPSRDGTPTETEETGHKQYGLRFPRSKTVTGADYNGPGAANRKGQSAIEVIELKCEREIELALSDLLGLRLSGSRSVGVFIQSVHAGSIADADGRIEAGDQLLNVESMSLIGLTPDQVVRVLRSSFSYTSLSVRLTVAHHWAGRYDRSLNLCFLQGKLGPSKSDGAIALCSEEDGQISALRYEPKAGYGKIDTGSISSAPLPGLLASATPLVEIHQPNHTTGGIISRPHTQGAAKVNRPRTRMSIEANESESTVIGSCEFEEENLIAANSTPSSASPAGSTARIDSILDMYNASHSEQSDKLSTLPPRPITSRKQSNASQGPARKASLQCAMVTGNDQSDLIIDKGRSIGMALPGALVKATTLRHRRVSHHDDPNCSTDYTNSSKSVSAKNTAITTLSNGTAGQQKEGNETRAWASDDSLHVLGVEEEDKFNVGKPSISLHADDIKHFISSAQRKSVRPTKDKLTNEQLPLVSFDQLNRTSPSPTDNHRKTQSGSSGQSKSSKGSVSSQSSQKLSWQCPVCLDGASRIRRTKRRMMSTACGHVFCSSCVEDVVGKYHMCPTCRMAIRSIKDVHPIFM